MDFETEKRVAISIMHAITGWSEIIRVFLANRVNRCLSHLILGHFQLAYSVCAIMRPVKNAARRQNFKNA